MVLNHGSIAKTLGGKGILRKKCIFLPQKWPKWPKMAKKSLEDGFRLRMATFGIVYFLHFFSPIALNGTFGEVENGQKCHTMQCMLCHAIS